MLDDVDAGGHFGDGMLDLQPRVHLDEVEPAVLEQELEGAHPAIADLPAGIGAACPDFGDGLRRDPRRRRLLDHLLVAPLRRAIATAQP